MYGRASGTCSTIAHPVMLSVHVETQFLLFKNHSAPIRKLERPVGLSQMILEY